jgi:hypothetical protein
MTKSMSGSLLDDVLPMISNGIKAVQKFEEFLNNSIEEDCFFECPKVGISISVM